MVRTTQVEEARKSPTCNERTLVRIEGCQFDGFRARKCRLAGRESDTRTSVTTRTVRTTERRGSPRVRRARASRTESAEDAMKFNKVAYCVLLILATALGCKKNNDFLGFVIGEVVDVHNEDVRAEREIGKPKSNLLPEVGYQYYKCKIKRDDPMYDTIYLCVSEDNKVISVSGERNFKSISDAVLTGDKIWNELKAKYGKAFVDAPSFGPVRHCGEIKDSDMVFLVVIKEDQCFLQIIHMAKEFATAFNLENERSAKREIARNAQLQEKSNEKCLEVIEDIVEDTILKLHNYYYDIDCDPYAAFRKITKELSFAFKDIDSRDVRVKKIMREVQDVFEGIREDAVADRKWRTEQHKSLLKRIEKGEMRDTQAKVKSSEFDAEMKRRYEEREHYISSKVEKLLHMR